MGSGQGKTQRLRGQAHTTGESAHALIGDFVPMMRSLLTNPDLSSRQLARKGFTLDTQFLRRGDKRRRELLVRAEGSRSQAKNLSRAARNNVAARDEGKRLREDIRQTETELRALEEKICVYLLGVPNRPSDRCPDGLTEDSKEIISTWGNQPSFGFKPRNHDDLAQSLSIFHPKRAARLSGTRFSILSGPGAVLERAIASYLLKLHGNNGYTEVSVPYIVGRQAMTATGQLPKFEDDLFKTKIGNREMFLIPTAEVPVTGLHAEETLTDENLPVAYCAYTPCFRAEAGAAGRDGRGLIRQHQFNKVELVRFCQPDQPEQQLELLVRHAEAAIQGLSLPYRKVALAAGDISFAAQFCYDLEVWLPGDEQYREISSCSDFGSFQARRARARYLSPSGERAHVATVNGSGLPIGRTIAAVLENNQHEDGSVSIPEALRPFTGFAKILPGGKTE